MSIKSAKCPERWLVLDHVFTMVM